MKKQTSYLSVAKKSIRVALPGVGALAFFGAAVFGQCVYQSGKITALERQLELAQFDHNRLAVREVACRLARVDSSPEQRLRIAGVFLSVKSLDEFWLILKQLENDSPAWKPAADHLRARGYLVIENRPACIAALKTYLASPGLSVAERVEGWKELADVQAGLGEWSDALGSTDIRIRLSDTIEARLDRARALIRLRRWQEVGVEFDRLKRTAPAHLFAKDLFPRWERTERALDSLRACDEAVKVAPGALRPRLERAMVEARQGLWQNAAEDLGFVALRAPTARLPLLLGSRIGMQTGRDGLALEASEERWVMAMPWLVPSAELTGLNETLSRSAENWRKLLNVDLEIAGTSATWLKSPEHAGRLARQAQLEYDLGAGRWAREDADEILGWLPDFLPAELVEIAVLLDDGNLAEAVRRLEAAYHENTDEGGKVPTSLVRVAAKVFQARGQHAAAVEAFSTCLAENRTADLLQARAKSLRFLQRFGEADQDIAAAQSLAGASTGEGQP